MGFADHYLEKQNFPYSKTEIQDSGNIDCCIVIPCFNEDKLPVTLESLWNCDRPNLRVLVLIVVNSPENAGSKITERNKKTLHDFLLWQKTHSDINLIFRAVDAPDLPKKHAGAGLARKIGMDAAVRLFNKYNNAGGIIVSLDADCRVEPNYLTAIETSFKKSIHCATICFEHDLSEAVDGTKNIIAGYELHLRCHIGFLRYIGFPNAYHTVGSCFAVSAQKYVQQGGMNMRQAGEDFYFLHKIFPVSSTIEINNTTVYPSSRISDRAPFGTGATLHKLEKTGIKEMMTYHPQAFYDLQVLVEKIPDFYSGTDKNLSLLLASLPKSLTSFVNPEVFTEKIHEIKHNTKNNSSFTKRFYLWFNAFMAVKFLNYSSLTLYPKVPVIKAADLLLSMMKTKINPASDCIDYLLELRNLQRNQHYINPLQPE